MDQITASKISWLVETMGEVLDAQKLILELLRNRQRVAGVIRVDHKQIQDAMIISKVYETNEGIVIEVK